jgi:hypothetical protein
MKGDTTKSKAKSTVKVSRTIRKPTTGKPPR